MYTLQKCMYCNIQLVKVDNTLTVHSTVEMIVFGTHIFVLNVRTILCSQNRLNTFKTKILNKEIAGK